MSGNRAVVGVFSYLDDTVSAIRGTKDRGLECRVYSPVPNHELEELTMPAKSPVRFFTFAGGFAGLIAGFALAILCSLDYPLRVSAKDVVSPPAFVVIGYECTILFGALFTLFSMFHFAKIPSLFRQVGYDPRFSDDKFGVVVSCSASEVEQVRLGLMESGAEEVEVRDAL